MRGLLSLSTALALALASVAFADDPPPTPAPKTAGRPADPAARARATREFLGLGVAPDAAAAARGKPVFQAQCAACHGAEARGGIGPNLIYSSVVLDDDHGEKLAPFLKVGRPSKGMPPFASLDDQQLKDVAEFLHQQVESVANRGTYENRNNIVVGDPARGAKYVKSNCSACHSVTGDLKGLAARYRPLDLQRNWIFPQRPDDGPRAFRAVVTTPQGVFKGRVRQVDDFRIVIVDDTETVHAFARDKSVKVQIVDPLAAHREIARTVKDRDLHDVTAYLETLK